MLVASAATERTTVSAPAGLDVPVTLAVLLMGAVLLRRLVRVRGRVESLLPGA